MKNEIEKIKLLLEKDDEILNEILKNFCIIAEDINKLLKKYIELKTHLINCQYKNCKYCKLYEKEIYEVLLKIKKIPKINFEYNLLKDNYRLNYTELLIGMIDYGKNLGITIPEMKDDDKLLISHDCKFLIIYTPKEYKVFNIFGVII